MLIAQINGNEIKVADHKELFPNASFTDAGPNESFMQENNCKHVNLFIAHNRETEKLVHCQPYIDGEWVYTVKIETLTEDELAAIAATKLTKLTSEITNAVQNRLDTFARTRNYDGILSACTYATSTNSQFKVEGQYCVDVRDATWAKLYEIMAAVQQGLMPAPTSYADVESELPVLEWAE